MKSHETEILNPEQAANELAKRFDFEHCDVTCVSACEAALASPKATYLFFNRYAALNGFAGPLVARLASSLGLSRQIFKQSGVPVDIADRDMLVAQKVFAATIDEYGDENQFQHTHRTLAQATVEAAASYAGLNHRQRRELSDLPEVYQPILTSFIDDYQGKVGDERALVRALGYHIASEVRADREYALIDEVFRHRNKGQGFHAYLKQNSRVTIDEQSVSAWYWVAAHGHYGGSGVEWDHFEAALDAVRIARRYSSVDAAEFNHLVDQGIQAFIHCINLAFEAITDECLALVSSNTNQSTAELI